MSGFDNGTNRARVEKIVDILGHLEKSAQANKAPPDEVTTILAPAIGTIEQMTGIMAKVALSSPEPSAPPAEYQWGTGGRGLPPGMKPRADLAIMEMAKTASLKDLTRAMAVYLNRLDEEFEG